jgi:hypothetical protein
MESETMKNKKDRKDICAQLCSKTCIIWPPVPGEHKKMVAKLAMSRWPLYRKQ